MTPDERAHAMELADQLLADIELDRLALDKLLMKSARLARIMGDEGFSEFVRKELHGYGTKDVGGRLWKLTKRHMGDAENPNCGGAAHIAANIGPLEDEIKSFCLPNVSGDSAATALRETRAYLNSIRNIVAKHRAVLVAVRVVLHDYVSKNFHLLSFSMRQGRMFEEAKGNIDEILKTLPGDALLKIDSAYRGISAGDPESIAGAMNSIRRLIDSVADSLFPATEETRQDGQGNQIKLGNQQRLNRMKAHIDDNVDAKGRGDRLKRSVSDIYARVSNGVHNDVAASEASYLFLSTYVLLGEIIALSSDRN
ncbi:hypothetical protein ACFWWS_12200 [Streptomyces sp. NPDC059083]|uniref:AbiTii domain-containing protein n=1 Tax=unclassified Streptomyces TaxID=2593676 RepID=UPI003692BE40